MANEHDDAIARAVEFFRTASKEELRALHKRTGKRLAEEGVMTEEEWRKLSEEEV
jgi:imidazolonepropionase-like amidohydrolase